jgi:Spy/CpxP family protein refolding chaperone
MRERIRQIFLSFILMIALIIALSPPAPAQGPPERGGWRYRGGGGMMGHGHTDMMDWISRLHLTEEQTARLQELRESYLRDSLPWRNELVIKRFDLRDLLRNPQSEPSAILAKQREISQLESKIEERALLYHIEMRKVLTPEQIKLLPPPGGEMHGPWHKPGWGWGMGREY